MMKLLLLVVMSLFVASHAAPQNVHQQSPEQQLNTLVTVIDRNVDARIELILQLLQIWRNHRQGISGQGGQINIAPLPYNPPTKAHSHSHSHGSDNKIPHHGHSHGHDDSDEDHSHEDHSHEDVDLQGADPEHKPGEVFVENFEKGVVQVDKKPIVPIGGHDH